MPVHGSISPPGAQARAGGLGIVLNACLFPYTTSKLSESYWLCLQSIAIDSDPLASAAAPQGSPAPPDPHIWAGLAWPAPTPAVRAALRVPLLATVLRQLLPLAEEQPESPQSPARARAAPPPSWAMCPVPAVPSPWTRSLPSVGSLCPRPLPALPSPAVFSG